MMTKLISVVKFDDKYFENGDVISVTTTDEKVYVGSVIIESYTIQNGLRTDAHFLTIDVSDNFIHAVKSIKFSEVKFIQKVNQ